MPLFTQESFDDPFDDPALVTTAFMDIMWQDENGMSALMLAAKDNRLLHLKGILKVAMSTNRLKQCLELRNQQGETASDIARNRGHHDIAKIIHKYESGRYKRRKRTSRSVAREMASKYKTASGVTSEDDVVLEIDSLTPPPPTSFMFRPMGLSRQKIPNGTRQQRSAISRSRSAHLARMRQNTQSIDDDDEEPRVTIDEQNLRRRGMSESGNGIMHNISEKFRTLMRFSNQDHSNHAHFSDELCDNNKDGLPGIPSSSATTATVRSDDDDGDFRSTPWSKDARPNLSASYDSPGGQGPSLKLPPILALRRRTASHERAERFVVAD